MESKMEACDVSHSFVEAEKFLRNQTSYFHQIFSNSSPQLRAVGMTLHGAIYPPIYLLCIVFHC